MTGYRIAGVEIREITRWWPLILIPAVIAVTGALWSVSHQHPTYSATTKLEVVPLVQWDETFVGTSLVRDSGDAKRTATTTAALLESPDTATSTAEYLGSGWTPESVADAITVTAVQNANVIDIVAKTDDPESAARVSAGFAKVTLDERWQKIAAELDARIEVLSEGLADPTAEGAATRLKTLTMIREAGSDPTLRMGSTSAAVMSAQQPVVTVVGVAAVGGLFIGVLAAFGIARLRRNRLDEAEPASRPEKSPAFSPNGGS